MPRRSSCDGGLYSPQVLGTFWDLTIDCFSAILFFMNFKRDGYMQWMIFIVPLGLGILGGLVTISVNQKIKEERPVVAQSAKAGGEIDHSCHVDTDCACGTSLETGMCTVGPASTVDPMKDTCPDFCTGIAGHLETKCVSGECKQVSRKPQSKPRKED